MGCIKRIRNKELKDAWIRAFALVKATYNEEAELKLNITIKGHVTGTRRWGRVG